MIPQELLDFLGHFGKTHTFGVIGSVNTHYHGTIEEHYDALLGHNKNGDAIYFIPNETDLGGAKIENVLAARCVFLDDDNPQVAPRSSFDLAPTCVVETSKGKYHYYWRTYCTDLSEWKLTVRRMIEKYKTDTSIHNSNRLMRLPTFVNHKTGKVSKLLYIKDDAYEWDKINNIWEKPIAYTPQESAPRAESRSMGTMIDIICAGQANSGLHEATRDYAYGQAKDGVKPATIKANLRNIMKDYDLTNPRMRENWNKVEAVVDSQVRKLQAASNPVEIPDIVQPLEWDWKEIRSNAIPDDCLPETLLNAAKEIGDWTAVGKDPAILSAVFITSALLSKNVLIHEIEDDLTTHCQSGIVIVMDTGARKSSIYKQMNKPFFKYEERLRAKWEIGKNKKQAKVKLLNIQMAGIEKEMAKVESESELDNLAGRMGDLQDRIDEIQVKKPSLRCADVTEEKLVRKLDENGGCIAVISDDARQVINNMKGKYNDKVSGESVYINSLTGSEIIYERVGSDKEIHIPHPVLNALLFVQPDAALALRNSDMYVPSGLAARLPMYFYPVSGADIVKNTDRRVVDKDKMRPYYQALDALCVEREFPLSVRLSANGMMTCKRIDEKLVKLLEGQWLGHYDKINKVVTLTMMYATAFAALDDAEFRLAYVNPDTSDYLLPTKYINMAFVFAENLFSQSITSHSEIEREGIPRKAQSLLVKIAKWYLSGKIVEGFVIQGDFKNHIYKGLRDDLPDLMDVLVEKGWVYVSQWEESKRKLNGGFPNKIVDTGDFVFHLNVTGIGNYMSKLDLDGLKGLDDVFKTIGCGVTGSKSAMRDLTGLG